MSKCLKCGAALPPVGDCPACAAGARQPAAPAAPGFLDRDIRIDRRSPERTAAAPVPTDATATLPGAPTFADLTRQNAPQPGRSAVPPAVAPLSGPLPVPRQAAPAPQAPAAARPAPSTALPGVAVPRAQPPVPGARAPTPQPPPTPAAVAQQRSPSPMTPAFGTPPAPAHRAPVAPRVEETLEAPTRSAPTTSGESMAWVQEALASAEPAMPSSREEAPTLRDEPVPELPRRDVIPEQLASAPTPARREKSAPPAPAARTPSVSGKVEVHARPASLWRRMLSFLTDAAVIAGISALYIMLASSVTGVKAPEAGLTGIDAFVAWLRAFHTILVPGVVLMLVLAVVYCAVAAFLWKGRTLGRLLLGLRLVDTHGLAPAPGRALLRAVLASLSFGLFLGGFWMALFDRRGQTLHDKLTSTFVIQPS